MFGRGWPGSVALLGALLLTFPLAAQDAAKTVSVNVKDALLTDVLKEVRRQAGVHFIYSDNELQKASRVNANFTGLSVDKAVETLLKGQPFTFRRDGNSFIISPAKPAEPRQAPGTQQAAKRTVKGKVTHAGTGNPLPGATVSYGNVNAITDASGAFAMEVPASCDRVTVSFVGFTAQVALLSDSGQIAVALAEAEQGLDDVVVTGYFNKSKSSFTGAVTEIRREELRKFGNVNLIEAMQLVDPSFKIKMNDQRGSDPNTLPDFFIRGESSFMGGNVPTFIVDGYEVSIQKVFDMDMERIESMTILKDASATILYGSRAANGVVVIETRRPATDRFMVSYNGRFSLSMPDLSDYDLMNASEKLDFEIKAGLYNPEVLGDLVTLEKIKSNVVRGVDTDWTAQAVRNSLSQSHFLYLEGGGEKITYGLGGKYSRNNGVMKESYRENYGINFDLTYRIRNKLNIRNSFEYAQTNVRNSPYGSFALYTSANPYNPIRDQDGYMVRSFTVHPNIDTKEGLPTQYQNPVYNATLPNRDEAAYATLTDNLSVDYYFTDEFRFKGSLALSRRLDSGDVFLSPDHGKFQVPGMPAEDKGSYTKSEGEDFSFNVNAMFTYNMERGKHIFFSAAGLNALSNRYSSSSYTATGFMNGNFSEIWFASKLKSGTQPAGSEGRDRMIGFLANVNYSYDNRYFVDLSGRADGSSKFGRDRQFAPFWSVGAGWNINKEHFLESAQWLTQLKLRASIGSTGDQSFEAYQARTMLRYSNVPYYRAMGASFIAYGNTALEWQNTIKQNVGIDLMVLQRRITARFDVYYNKTSALLLPVSTPTSMGFASYTENLGKQINRGYEFDVTGVVIRRPNFDWALNFSGTRNSNEIARISDALRNLNEALNADPDNQIKPISYYQEGESKNAIKAVRSLGINPATGKELFLTRSGEMTEVWDYRDKYVAGCTDPKLEGHFGTNVIWKNFSLNAIFRYSIGSQVYNSTLAERVEGADPHRNADRRVIEERWQKPGDLSFYKDIAERTPSKATSRFVQDNDYLEFGNISIAYRMSAKALKGSGLSNVRFGLNSANLFYVSTVKRERGLDYPFARQYTFSINLNF